MHRLTMHFSTIANRKRPRKVIADIRLRRVPAAFTIGVSPLAPNGPPA
jgi:hypothetical protein